MPGFVFSTMLFGPSRLIVEQEEAVELCTGNQLIHISIIILRSHPSGPEEIKRVVRIETFYSADRVTG